jgi:hypothetical protein
LDRQARWGIYKFSALLLVVIDDFEIGIHDIFVRLRRAASRGPGGTGWIVWLRSGLLGRCLFIQFSADRLESTLQLFRRLLDRFCVGTVQLFANILDSVFNPLRLFWRLLLAQFS